MRKILTLFLISVFSFNQAVYALSMSDRIIIETQYDKSLSKISDTVLGFGVPTSLDTELRLKDTLKNSHVRACIILTIFSPMISDQEKLFMGDSIDTADAPVASSKSQRAFDWSSFGESVTVTLQMVIGVPIMGAMFLIMSPFALCAALLDL